MPDYDGTGPRGEGPRTGRGAGYCPPGCIPEPNYNEPLGIGRGMIDRGYGRLYEFNTALKNNNMPESRLEKLALDKAA